MRAGGRASDGSDDVRARCVNVSFGVSVSRGPLCKCIIWTRAGASARPGVRPGRGEARAERRGDDDTTRRERAAV